MSAATLLDTFYSVIDTGSYTAAGRQLGIKEDEVRRHVRALGKVLGEPVMGKWRGRPKWSIPVTRMGQHLIDIRNQRI